MVVLHVIGLLCAISVSLPVGVASTQLASFGGGFTDDHSGGLQVFDFDNTGHSLDSHQLVPRQQTVCPANYPVHCGVGLGCCRTGKYCCTNINGCCPTDSICYSSPQQGCCPKSAETCGKGFCLQHGQTCCGNGACSTGYVCLKSPSGTQTCCLSGMTACENGSCCYKGTKCSTTKPGKCELIQPTTSSSSSSRRSSASPNPQRPSPSPSRKPNPPTKPPKLKCKSTHTYEVTKRTAAPDPSDGLASWSYIGLELGKRQDDTDVFGQYCETDDEKIPVMIFPWYPGESDELIENTCKGISLFGGTDEVLLTWAGDGSAAADRRRRKNCPPKHCANMGQKYNVLGLENECDEFPPASSLENEKRAHVMCIDKRQNQLGGKIIQSYSALYKLKPNQPFIVRVVPTCGRFASTTKLKRTVSNLITNYGFLEKRATEDQFSGSNSSWIQDRRPGAQSGVGFIFGSLPELTSGPYNISFGFSGPVVDLSVFDSAGLEYFSTTSASPGQSYNFTVEGENLPIAVAAYAKQDTNVNLTYHGQRVGSGSKKASASFFRPLEIRALFYEFTTLTLVIMAL